MTAIAPEPIDDADFGAVVVPYVPRLTIEWLREDPERLWREVDGTLAFVDISGFTAMSERLAGRGKAGAEEVTDVMNSVFAALLDDAYAYGGGLLKFGGDALLLLYDGDGHAPRAARAAHRMRRTLRSLGELRTSAGRVVLRMHVGVHSARLHFFLVGTSHRELLVLGPGATRTVEMEAASEAGEILLSPETAAALEQRTLGAAKDAGVLLKGPPQASERFEPLPDVAGLPLESAIPSPVRAELSLGPLEGEHRHATIGFIRFAGTDDLLASRGPAAVAAAVAEVVAVVQDAADEHQVTFLETDIDRDGGRIVLVAGAPQTTGDDEERLLRTLRRVLDTGVPLALAAGAARGRVFAGQVGAPFRRTYTVLGDTAALAARLMARAQSGEILVSNDLLDGAYGSFATRELEPLKLKGKSRPVGASALGELLEEKQARVVLELPFVDRERERAVLGASVAPVRAGFGTLVELVGEPGIGKSRLADELRRLCEDMASLTVSCDQYASSTPYRAFRDLLRGLLAVTLDGDGAANGAALAARLSELGPELTPWAPLLAAPLDVEIDSTPEVDDLEPAFRRARLHGLVAGILAKLLDAPTLIVLEDVHWMDEPSADLLRHIGTQLPTHPWLACTTRRAAGAGFSAAEGTPPLPAFTLRLEPLPAADARALVEAAAGGRPLRGDELEAIAERGGGNPLFLQELATAGAGANEPEDLPESVEAVVAARIDGLAPPDRTLLRWASVLGVSFSGTVLQAVLADDPSVAADSAAWDRLVEFVERDPDVPGGFRFRHALIRDAAYEGLSYRRRRELHSRVAEVVETRFAGRTHEVSDLLSLHFHRAGLADPTWRYSVEAAGRAREKWANVEAAELLRRALDAARSMPELATNEVAEAWEGLGDCLHLAGELDEAARAFAAARKLRGKDAPEQVDLMRKEGALREATGRYSEALRWYGRGLTAAAGLEDDGLRIRQRNRLRLAQAQVRFRQGSFEECIRRCKEIVADALDADDLRTLAPTYLLLHTVYTYIGSPERMAFSGIALPLYEELGDLKGQAATLNSLGIEAYYSGDWAKALDLYERSRALFERIGDVISVAIATNNIGEILSDQGHLDEAVQLFEDARRAATVAGQRPLATVAAANSGRAAARARRFEEAEDLLVEALATFSEMNVGGFVLETEARLAELDVLRGDRPREALARAESVVVREADVADMGPLLATALRLQGAARLQLGDREGAQVDVARSVDIARDADALYELALALELQANALGVGNVAESAELYERLGVEAAVPLPLGPPD